MKNSDLIEQLSKFPKDADVMLSIAYDKGRKHKTTCFMRGKYNMYPHLMENENTVVISADS